MVTKEETVILLSIPISAFMLLLLASDDTEAPQQETSTAAVTGTKEVTFLRYNQDGIYSNFLAAEEHFRNLAGDNKNRDFNQCAVKHLSLSSNHSGEAVSHTVATGNPKDSTKYAKLYENTISLQHDVQDGKVTPQQGIERVRELKHEFEAFNPSFDISKCKACEIT